MRTGQAKPRRGAPRRAESVKRPHFFEYDPRFVSNPEAPYAVLPVPYERTVSFGKGTGRAPAAIISASEQLELFDEELRRPLGLGVQTLKAINCRSGSDAHILELIRRAAKGVLESGRFLLALGGEHTITFPIVAAAKAAFGDLSVLHLDAHLDLRNTYEHSRFSHACVMRRVMELGVNVVSAGVRSVCAEEYGLVKERHLPVFWARDIVRAASDAWMGALLKQLGKRVYITIDADCLDPSLMPGTGTPEPDGFGWHAITALLRRICAERQVVAADLVEVVSVPGTPVCEYIAARLAAKLLLYHKTGMRRR